ncbi:MAG TPA: VOC family protein [Kofleriaceae bacterium]
MIDHTGIRCADLDKSVEYFKKALAPIGYELIKRLDEYKTAGFGEKGKADFWVNAVGKPAEPGHIAFRVGGREQVRKFYAAAIAAGGTDNGGPGERPHYHENYYAAFVLDPDGNNIEVVCHEAFLG